MVHIRALVAGLVQVQLPKKIFREYDPGQDPRLRKTERLASLRCPQPWQGCRRYDRGVQVLAELQLTAQGRKPALLLAAAPSVRHQHGGKHEPETGILLAEPLGALANRTL